MRAGGPPRSPATASPSWWTSAIAGDGLAELSEGVQLMDGERKTNQCTLLYTPVNSMILYR